jgi:IS30 family transposase
MKKYKRLSLVERVKIQEFRELKYSPSKIAEKLGRNKSTITRELKRNRYAHKDYWRKKLSNYTSKKKTMSLQDENKKLKEKLQELEWIKDFQQDVIVEFEKVTGKELSKELLPKHLANEIQKRKKKLK